METIETLGKYEVKRTLGRGAMGTVYEGWDPIIARRVAIKTVKIPDADDPETEEQLARFRREAQAAGRLTHPNIVGVFDYGETSDLAYIVMEFVDGPPLKSLLDKQERFAIPDMMRIMEDLLAGLQFSHDRGVVHRDIKPANVMLTSGGQAKIADFGIARIESSSMTQAGTVLGTPAYMSPEQFMGQVVDARSDIYSSGVLLYQLLTGERPFEGGLSAIMHKALNTEPPWPSQISVTCPPAFDAVVRKAMAKRPEDRFQSAGAFLEALRVAASGQAAPAAESADEATMVVTPRTERPRAGPVMPTAPAAVTPTKRSSVPMLAGLVVVLLLLVGGGAWFVLLRSPAPTQSASTGAESTSSGLSGAQPVIGSDAPAVSGSPSSTPSDSADTSQSGPAAQPAASSPVTQPAASSPTTTASSQPAPSPASVPASASSASPAPQTTAGNSPQEVAPTQPAAAPATPPAESQPAANSADHHRYRCQCRTPAGRNRQSRCITSSGRTGCRGATVCDGRWQCA